MRPSVAPTPADSVRAGRAHGVGILAGGGGEQLGVGDVAGIARLHRLAGGDVHARRRGARARPRRSTRSCPPRSRCRPRTPACAAGVTRRHGNSSASAAASASTWSRVWSADSATRSRDVPGGTVGGRMAVTRKPRAGERVGGLERARLAAAHVRHDRRRMPGPQAVDVGAQPGPQRVALGGAQHAQRGERGGGVGGARRGGEDVGAGAVDQQVGVPARAGDEPAERAEGLRQRADAQHRRRRRGRSNGRARARCAPRRARAARRGARTRRASLSTGATSPSIEKIGLGDDDRARRGVRRAAARRRGRRRGGGRPRAARRRGAARR